MLPVQVQQSLAVNILIPLLATAGVVLRGVARRRKRARLTGSDYTIVLALITVYGLTATGLLSAVEDAWGDLLLDAQASQADVLQEMMRRSKLMYADGIISYLCFWLVKVSVLLFYKEIFTIRWFKIAVYTLIAIATAWFISAELTHIFNNIPVTDWWEQPVSIATKRYNYWNVIIAESAFDIFIDLLIWILPLILIRRLKISRARKISLVAIFSLGFFCMVTSVMRLYYCYVLRGISLGQYPNTSESTAEYSANAIFRQDLWSHVEAGISVLTACLPTLAPLLPKKEIPQSVILFISGGRTTKSEKNASSSRLVGSISTERPSLAKDGIPPLQIPSIYSPMTRVKRSSVGSDLLLPIQSPVSPIQSPISRAGRPSVGSGWVSPLYSPTSRVEELGFSPHAFRDTHSNFV